MTTLKPVPPGTNGAISLGGTLASITGGLIMGFTMFASLIMENSRCREEWVDITIPLLMWGASAGGFGSLVWLALGSDLSPKVSFVAARFNFRSNYSTDVLLLGDKAHFSGPHWSASWFRCQSNQWD